MIEKLVFIGLIMASVAMIVMVAGSLLFPDRVSSYVDYKKE